MLRPLRRHSLSSRSRRSASSPSPLCVHCRCAVLSAISATYVVDVKYYAPGGANLGGGKFFWGKRARPRRTTAAASSNPTGNTGAGRWMRLIPHGYVTPEMFGAGGQGASDDTVALRAAVASGPYRLPARQNTSS